MTMIRGNKCKIVVLNHAVVGQLASFVTIADCVNQQELPIGIAIILVFEKDVIAAGND